MNLADLYNIADDEKIEIMTLSLPLTKSMSIMTDDGDCYIGLDDIQMETKKTAHEIGHCVKGAFYNRYFNVLPVECVALMTRNCVTGRHY